MSQICTAYDVLELNSVISSSNLVPLQSREVTWVATSSSDIDASSGTGLTSILSQSQDF